MKAVPDDARTDRGPRLDLDALLGWLVRHRPALVLAGLAVTAYVGALGRGETMLWSIAALLAATLLVGVLWPHWLVRQLDVERRGPSRATEGEVVRFRVALANRGRLPRFTVEVVDRLPFVAAARGDDGPGETVLAIVGHLAGGATRALDVEVRCDKRGEYRLGPVELASTFPLGLAEARQRRPDTEHTLVVYPQLFPITSLPLRGTPSLIHRGGLLLPETAGAAEFCGLREYRRGDNPRHIHWPTSARSNQLMVKEFEPTASACLCLALDLARESNIGRGRDAAIEVAIRIAASVARHAIAHGIPFRIAGTMAVRDIDTWPGTSPQHFRDALETLAVIDGDGRTPYASVLARVGATLVPGETVVLFMAEPETRMQQTLDAVALLRARGAHLWAITFDRPSFTGLPERSEQSADRLAAGLLGLGATHLPLGRGADLVQAFNP